MKISLWFAIALLLISCAQESNKLLPEPDKKLEKTKLTSNITFTSKVDILFVVDDSYSMDEHQRNLVKNIDLFVDEMTRNRILDYHVGVLSSSADSWSPGACSHGLLCGERARYVDRTTPNGIDILKENLRIGTGGSATERFFDPVNLALTSTSTASYNAGFYRPDAFLAVVFLTDAEDQSSIGPDDFYQLLLKLKNGDKKKILGYGAIIPTVDPFHCSRDEGRPPTRIERFYDLVGGSYYNLCDPNFGRELAKISGDISAKVGRVVTLDRPPVIDTIKITYGTQLIPNDPILGWTYDPSLNAIILSEQIEWLDQGPNVKLEVSFSEAVYPSPKPPKKPKK